MHPCIAMSDYLVAHIKWLEHRLATESMDDLTRCQVVHSLILARGY